MKFKIPFLFALFILFSHSSYSAIKIDAKDAAFHEGEDVIACGVLKQVAQFKHGLYLNLDARYPNQSLTFVVWEDNIAGFKKENGSLTQLVGHQICGKGTITEYHGRHQISLYNAYSLKVL